MCILSSRTSNRNPKTSEFSVNNPFFVKRQSDLEMFIASPVLRDAYLTLMRWMNRETRTCFPEHRRVAEAMKCSIRTLQRRLRALEALGVIITKHRKKSCRSNLSNFYTFPLLNDDFLRDRCQEVGVKSVMVKRDIEIKEQTTTGAVAPKPIHNWKPDPPRPKPDPEILASIERGRELRRSQWRSQHHRATFVPSSDSFGTPTEEQAAKMLRETEETLDRINPGWRAAVNYGL